MADCSLASRIALVLAISAATIDRLLVDVKVAASGGRRRRVGFYSAIRRDVPIRTFNDWNSPPPGFCEVDMVAHGGTSVAGSFIQTLTMVDIATGWTERLALLTRDGSLVVEAMKLKATAAYDGPETARDGPSLCNGTTLRQLLSTVVQAQGEGPRRGESHQALSSPVDAVSARAGASKGAGGRKAAAMRSISLAPFCRTPGRDLRHPGRTRQSRRSSCRPGSALATCLHEHRPKNRSDVRHRNHRPYKTRVRITSKLDPHIAAIKGWFAERPQFTAIEIIRRLCE